MKTIAISDAHLGQFGTDNSGYYSLLSSRCQEPAAKAKLAAFVRAVNTFAGNEKITLIGVGDILDLSLSFLGDALADLSQLLELLPCVHTFDYVIGNHDHHIWTMECERKRTATAMIQGKLPLANSIYYPFSDETGTLMSSFLGQNTRIRLHYPSLHRDNITFTHGHLFGGLYTFVSDVLAPFLPVGKSYEEIAATVNTPLLEFIYWQIGEAGFGMGADGVAEAIFADVAKGNKSLLHDALDSAVEVLLPKGIIFGFPDSWERALARWIGRNIIKYYVKEQEPLSSVDRFQEVDKTRKRANEWLSKTKSGASLIVSGHTHVIDDGNVAGMSNTLNLGSWLVEPGRPEPDSCILFIDGNHKQLVKI